MNTQDIHDIYGYNCWANHRLLEMASKVTPAQFVAPSAFSYSNLQATLVHTLDAEYQWRGILENGVWQPAELQPTDFPAVDVLQGRWQQEEEAMWKFLNALRDEDMARIIHYKNDLGEPRERLVWHIVYHVVNHGMQHRAEAAVLLTS